MKETYKVVKSIELSKTFDDRFVVIDPVSGEVLDDAQGYGYTSPQNAVRAYAYKHRDRSKDPARRTRKLLVGDWVTQNEPAIRELEQAVYDGGHCYHWVVSSDNYALFKQLLPQFFLTPPSEVKLYTLFRYIWESRGDIFDRFYRVKNGFELQKPKKKKKKPQLTAEITPWLQQNEAILRSIGLRLVQKYPNYDFRKRQKQLMLQLLAEDGLRLPSGTNQDAFLKHCRQLVNEK